MADALQTSLGGGEPYFNSFDLGGAAIPSGVRPRAPRPNALFFFRSRVIRSVTARPQRQGISFMDFI
jgi:hypothetical protein